MPRPAAYLRKSSDSSTKQDQLARLMSSVEEYGHNGDTVLYDDWARSGDHRKLASRKEWRRMCQAIERGDHDVVFMNDLDRGGRSLEEWLRFMRVAQDHGVKVVANGIDWSAPERRMEFRLRALIAEEELEASKRRARTRMDERRRRGDALGGTPYGKRFACAECGRPKMSDDCTHGSGKVVVVDDPDRPVEPLLLAVADARGNIPAAVRLLNERGVPTRYPTRRDGTRRLWSDAALRGTLRRLGKLPPVRTRARRNGHTGELRSPSPLSKLVLCHCGQTMTPVDSRNELYCYVGSRQGAAVHGKTKTTQRVVYDFLRAEIPRVKRIRIEKRSAGSGKTRADVEEELRRLGRAYRAGTVDDDEFDAETARLRRSLEDFDALESDWIGFSRPALVVDFDGDPVALGDALRQRVRAVHLDESLRPARVEWRGQTPRR